MKEHIDNKPSLYEDVIKNGYDVRSGAFAVVNPDIKMVLNEYGEYEARADDLSVFEDPALARVSAMLSEENEDTVSANLFGSIEGIKHQPILGYYSGLYAGYVAEGDYRANGSSGGLTTWILKELLERKLIDGVIHVKQSDEGSEVLFEYGISETIGEVSAHSKSRYYPAEFSRAINEIKSKSGKYAVVGIPSLIMELRLLCQVDEDVDERIAFTLGLICGHQKSTKYAESIAWQFGVKPGDLKTIDFRKKIKGLPSNKYATEITGLIDGKETTISKMQDEIAVTNWGQGFFKTKFSDYTDDALNETADVALGDAWLPEYTPDSGGNNVMIVRNDIIQEIIDDGIANGKLKLDSISESKMLQSQSGLTHHTRDELPYRLHKRDEEGVWRPRKRVGPDIRKVSKLKRKVQDIREEIVAVGPEAYRKAVGHGDWGTFTESMEVYVSRYKSVYRVIKLKRVRQKGPVWIAKKIIEKLT